MHISAEIEEYEENNSRVKVNFYRHVKRLRSEYIKHFATLDEMPRDQAEAIVVTVNRFNEGPEAVTARLKYLEEHFNEKNR